MSDKLTLADLTPDPQNARRHNPRNIGMIEKSLNDVGAARSIVIDEAGVVLAGNGLVEAAAQAGIERVRVVEADGNEIIAVRRSNLTPEQKTMLALYDNRTTDLSDFDPGVLAGLAEDGVDLSGLWFPDELSALLAEVQQEETQEDGPVSVDETQPTRCQPGDVWCVGRHTVACLDSTEPGNLDRVVRGTVAMVWADPPYGIDFDPTKDRRNLAPSISRPHVIGDDSTDTARACAHLCLSQWPDSVHVWWGANNYADELPPSTCWLVWDKENTGDFADVELGWTNIEQAARIFRHMWNGMLKDSERGERRIHSTQKPIALCAWAFEKYGSAGDLILDPFLGSGPSLKAAEKMGRTVIGFELSPHYVDHIIEWAEAEGLSCERVDG